MPPDACAMAAAEGMTTMREGPRDHGHDDRGRSVSKPCCPIWITLTSGSRPRLSSAPAAAVRNGEPCGAIGKRSREAIRTASGLSSAGSEMKCSKQKSAQDITGRLRRSRPRPKLMPMVVGRTRARSGCDAVAQLRQRIGHRPRKPEIEKTEKPEQDPYDRDHAIARLADKAQVDRDGDKRDRDPRQWREQIDGETRLERLSRHDHLRPVISDQSSSDPYKHSSICRTTPSVGQVQPKQCAARRAGQNYSKLFQAKPSKTAWICLVLFVRIGTFQRVIATPNEFFSAWETSPGCKCGGGRPAITLLGAVADLSEIRRLISGDYSGGLFFAQENVG